MVEIMRAPAGALQLSTAARIAGIEALTGVLTIGAAGRISFLSGEPVEATHGATTGVEALLEHFLDPPAELALHRLDQPARPALGALEALVQEGGRLALQWSQVAPRVLVEVSADSLSDHLAPLAEGLDGRRPLWSVLNSLQIPRVRLLDAITRLVDLGALVDAAPPVPIPVALVPTDPDADAEAWLRVGQRLCHEDRHAEAITAFQQALALRPDHPVARRDLARAQLAAARQI